MRASMRACACQNACKGRTCGFVRVRVHLTDFMIMNPLQGSSAVILCICLLWLMSEFDVNAGCVCSISSSDLCEKVTPCRCYEVSSEGDMVNVCFPGKFVFLTLICEENKQNLMYFCLWITLNCPHFNSHV